MTTRWSLRAERPRRRGLSLRARLLLLTMGLLFTGLSLIRAIVSDRLEHYQLDRADTQLRSFTSLSAGSFASAVPQQQPVSSPRLDLLDPALDLFGTPYLLFLDSRGTVTREYHNSRFTPASLPSTEDLRRIPRTGKAVSLRGTDGSVRWRAVATPWSTITTRQPGSTSQPGAPQSTARQPGTPRSSVTAPVPATRSTAAGRTTPAKAAASVPGGTARSLSGTGSAAAEGRTSGTAPGPGVGGPQAESGGTVIAATSLTASDETITKLRKTSMISGFLLLVLLTPVGWLALSTGLRPLRRIERTAVAIAGGDLSRRVPNSAAANTEIGRLEASLNTMLGQLEQAFADRAASEDRMRTLLSDVSHELRTPLFGIKGSTELYRMGALPEQADVDATMDRINREATRLTTLTTDLLLLAQLDTAPESQLEFEPMDLRTLANDARHDLRALDPTRPITFTGPRGDDPPGPAPVNGDEARLRQVVTNLVGNAVRHTPPGTAVRIGVGTIDGRAVLDVADSGPGMTTEQANRAFDRFYRGNRPSPDTNTPSTGLGLAIARSLARAHGGDLELHTRPDDGAHFRLALPLPGTGPRTGPRSIPPLAG